MFGEEKGDFMTVGIYKIENTRNGKLYFGQSKHVEKRLNQHKSALRGGYHHSDHLQNSFNKYGENAFSFELVKACKPRYLDRFEKLYIHLNNTIDRDYGYNKESGGHANKTVSDEAREKNREAHLGENHPQWKDYPRIVKAGFNENGKQQYKLVVEGKIVCTSTNLELLEKKLKNNDFTPINTSPVITDEPHIIKVGFYDDKQQYAIYVDGKKVCQSTDLKLMEEKLENEDFTPIYTDEPHIKKSGFDKNGKQRYAIVKNSEVLCESIYLEKLEQKLENMKKTKQLNGDDLNEI